MAGVGVEGHVYSVVEHGVNTEKAGWAYAC